MEMGSAENFHMIEHPELNVSQFYRNAVVLITGSTGFLGKVLLEKLLRSFDVKKIYLLVREKQNLSPSERVQQLIKDPIFETIRRTVIHTESLFAKLEAIDVDFSVDEFVKEPFKTNILNDTQIVFHIMASVSLNDSLHKSLETNVNSAEKLYSLIRNAKSLKSIVHVSTFYSNSNLSHIEEKIYDDVSFGGLENLRRIMECLSEPERKTLTPVILGSLPNTYVFSKKCAEVMVQRKFSELPIGIFRPPIVCPSYGEPEPGWMDRLQAITGLSVPTFKQTLLLYYGDGNAKAALAPVDYCVAGSITAACDIEARYERSRFDKVVPVYNFYFEENPITWNQYFSMLGATLPSRIGRMLSPLRNGVLNRRMLSRMTFWLQYLLAYIADCLLGIFGKPKRNVRAVSSLKKLCDASEFFRCHTWTAQNENVKRIRSLLAPCDEKLLEFDVSRIQWSNYFEQFAAGISKYMARRKVSRRGEYDR